MSFSQARYKQVSNGAFLSKVIRRTLLIFLLGFLMYWFPFFRVDDAGHIAAAPLAHTRIFGVLQRIALCYFFASLLLHYCSTRAVYIISAVLLVGYWLLLLWLGDVSDPFGMTTNAGFYLDRTVLGEAHMYHGEGVAFDPEGILSTLPAIVNVVVGYFAGAFIQRQGKGFETMTKLLLMGGLFIFIALFWNMVFPLNKKIWSSSFVMLTTGIDLMLIAALLYVVEWKKWNGLNWTRFFLVFGKNPLFIYLLSELLVVALFMIHTGSGQSLFNAINANFYQVIAPGAIGSLLFALSYMLVCWLIGLVLDKRGIYVRV